MSKLADPLVCPDCRSLISPQARCTGCGLDLSGPLATPLWRSLLQADELIERIRSAQRSAAQPAAVTPAAGTATAGAAAAGTPDAPAIPAPPVRPPAPRGLPVKTVPLILYTLGGLFILAMAVIFLAVTWPMLPLLVKALILVVVTAGFGVAAWLTGRRGLRGAAEALWTIAGFLVVLDVNAAHSNNLFGFGAIAVRHAASISGVLLVVASVGFAFVAGRLPIKRVIAAELMIVLGAVLLTVGEVALSPDNDGPAQAIAVPLLAAGSYALLRWLRWPAYAVGGLALVCWMWLAGAGLDQIESAASRSAAWTEFAGWPLLLAAAYAAVPALLPALTALPRWVRTVSAGLSLSCLALLTVAPLEFETTYLVLVAAVSVVLAGLAHLRIPAWSTAAGWLSAGFAAFGTAVVLAQPWMTLAWVYSRRGPFEGAPANPVGGWYLPESWTLPMLGVAAAVALLGLARVLPVLRPGTWMLAPGLVGSGALGMLGDLGAALGWYVAATVLVAALWAVPLLIKSSGPSLVRYLGLAGALGHLGLAVLLAAQDELLTSVLATALAAACWAAVARRRGRDQVWAALAAAGAVVFTNYATWAWLQFGRVPDHVAAPVLAGLAVALLLLAPVLLRGGSRIVMEASTVVPALTALAVALIGDAQPALTLTVLGSGAALWSVLFRDRTYLSWLATAILGLAFFARVEVDGPSPEAYTLPAAALLIGVGAWRLLRDPQLSSWKVTGSGLTLALAPSLLLGLDDPYSLRLLLVGLAAVVALGAGILLRWQAPFLIGAGTLTAIALRHLLPLLGEFLDTGWGAWVFFGALGISALVLAVLWEYSLTVLRRGWAWVGSLR